MVSKVREVQVEKPTVLFVLLSGLRIGGNNSRAISLGTTARAYLRRHSIHRLLLVLHRATPTGASFAQFYMFVRLPAIVTLFL